MFCSQCGKRVTENMLFCPFCGKPIVIPEQETAEATPVAAHAEPQPMRSAARDAQETAEAMPVASHAEPRQPRTAVRETQETAEATHVAHAEPQPMRSAVRDAQEMAEMVPVAAHAEPQPMRSAARETQETAEAVPVAAHAEPQPPRTAARDAQEAAPSASANASDNLPRTETSLFSERLEEAQGAETSADEPQREDVLSTVRNAPVNVRAEWKTPDRRPTSERSEFQPLDLNRMEDEPRRRAPQATEALSDLLAHQLREEPVRLKGRAPDLTNVHNPDRPGATSRRRANTYAPVREFDPEDMFMDGDDYDEEDDDGEAYAYEEPEEGGFFIRHIRGVVGLSLFIIVLAIVAGWAFSGGGQRVLAQANLAWQPSIYEQLGYEAYQNGQYAVAAGYYVQALGRDAGNYSYAYSAGVADYMAGDTEQAAEMGKRAVEIDPTRLEGYQLLQRLYPDAANRPWEIQSLLQQGYRLTGDASLNDAPQQ